MAITLVRQPALFTTKNQALYQITSDVANIYAFRVLITDKATGGVIATQKYATIPQLPSGTVFDLSSLLSSYVEPELKVNTTLVDTTSKNYRKVNVQITELYFDANSAVQQGATLNAGDFTIFDAQMSQVGFNSFSYPAYVMDGTSTGVKFLSSKPLVSNLLYSSYEYLYLLATVPFKVVINFYKIGNPTPVSTYTSATVTPTATGSGFRINISPVVISTIAGLGFGTTSSSPFQNPFNIVYGTSAGSQADYFTVQVFNSAGTVAISELRTYRVKYEDCKKQYVQLLFENYLGGIDSLTFIQPQQKIHSEKTKIQINPYGLNSYGSYTNVTNSVYNPTEKIIASQSSSIFTAVTEPMHDYIAYYARGIFETDNVYVRLATGELFPITITQSDYAILRNRIKTDNNRLNITFTISDINFGF